MFDVPKGTDVKPSLHKPAVGAVRKRKSPAPAETTKQQLICPLALPAVAASSALPNLAKPSYTSCDAMSTSLNSVVQNSVGEPARPLAASGCGGSSALSSQKEEPPLKRARLEGMLADPKRCDIVWQALGERIKVCEQEKAQHSSECQRLQDEFQQKATRLQEVKTRVEEKRAELSRLETDLKEAQLACTTAQTACEMSRKRAEEVEFEIGTLRELLKEN